MKPCLILLMAISPFHGLLAEPPAEITAAKARYETALAAAGKPVRERYLQELQQIKNRAMASKNLELAVAVDAEIKLFVPVAAAAAPKAAEAKGTLSGTRWEYPRSGLPKEMCWVEFRPDGLVVRGWAAEGEVWADHLWSMVDESTVKFRVFSNPEFRWRFDRRFSEAEELDAKGEPTGRRFDRIKIPSR
jgi:hypothetical protein